MDCHLYKTTGVNSQIGLKVCQIKYIPKYTTHNYKEFPSKKSFVISLSKTCLKMLLQPLPQQSRAPMYKKKRTVLMT